MRKRFVESTPVSLDQYSVVHLTKFGHTNSNVLVNLVQNKGSLIKKFMTMFFVAALSSGAWGDSFVSGKKFLARCQSGEAPLRVWCSGYLQGIADADDAYATDTNTQHQVCIPKDQLSTKQLRSAVLSYLENQPQELASPAGSLVLQAYRELFPCE